MWHPDSPITIPEQYLEPINWRGLKGRQLRLPAENKKAAKRKVVLLYGHHASLERIYAAAGWLTAYGEVLVPDLPGCGGMDSFYKLGRRKPTIEDYGEYLDEWFEEEIGDEPCVVVGMSLGALFIIHALFGRPQLQQKITKAIGFVAFADVSNISLSRRLRWTFISTGFIGSTWLGSKIIRYGFLNTPVLDFLHKIFGVSKDKLAGLSAEAHREAMRMEHHLWQDNDVRTHFRAFMLLLRVKAPTVKQPIALPFYNIYAPVDQYFDNAAVNRTLRQLFKNYQSFPAKLDAHAPSVVESREAIEEMIPAEIKAVLES